MTNAIVVTFTADDTDYNVWVWPDSQAAEVNMAPAGSSSWLPHLGDIRVEVQR